jgi:hypothetical protein
MRLINAAKYVPAFPTMTIPSDSAADLDPHVYPSRPGSTSSFHRKLSKLNCLI